MARADSLVELRVLDGPNRHLNGPAVQLRLDVRTLLRAAPEDMRAWADEVGLPDRDPATPDGPGTAGSAARTIFVRRWLCHVTSLLAELGGVTAEGVVSGPGFDEDELVVAFGWLREGEATKLGEWVAWCVDDAGRMPLAETLDLARHRLRSVAPGPASVVVDPVVPTVAITGTNGKTTTTRLTAALARACGHRVAWNATDGVHAADDTGHLLLEEGDWAGFNGAARVMGVEGVEVAVVESARGGMLRRGMGVSAVDVGVVTNVTADHLGDMGIHTLEDLAQLKATVIRAVRPDGWAVLNGADARVRAMAAECPGGVCLFAADPGVVLPLGPHARAVTVTGGMITLHTPTEEPVPLVSLADVPVTIAGLSAHNVANALAAAAAAWCLGLDIEGIAAGLGAFLPDRSANPGRLNPYVTDDVLVIADVAHNGDSLVALCDVGRGLVAPGSRLHVIAGTMGDRHPDIVTDIGRIAASRGDTATFAQKDSYLRGRDPEELATLLLDGAAAGGVPDAVVHPDELAALDAVLAMTGAGDVVCFAVHVNQGDIAALMARRGARPADGEDIRRWARVAATQEASR